ncbi:MAG: hypothetical protein R8L58_03350, partial [Mariprofundaceae bacterium]
GQPEAEPSETEPSETEPSETEQPEAGQSETEQPETEQPETEQPETKSSETEQPETKPSEAEPSEAEPSEAEPSEAGQPEIQQEAEQEVEQENRGLAATVLKGEVMPEIWPKVADPRLLRVLTRQVEGALQLLNESTENGLIKISEVLEKEAGTEIEGDIMDALTELQNIDRVMQRLHNVRSCLDEWSQAVKDVDAGEPGWQQSVADRYVMEEERLVLRDEL